jgi:general stress protein 26
MSSLSRHVVTVAAVALLIVPLGARGQQPAPAKPQPTREEAVAAARTIMADARYATLVTLDRTGHPQARIVDPFAPEGDMAIWVATNARTRKVAQIDADPRVTLTYSDPGRQSYVTVLGIASLVRDPAEKAKRWKPEWEAFYEDRNKGDEYLLILGTPQRLEVVSERLGMVNDPVTWRPVIVDLSPSNRGRNQ